MQVALLVGILLNPVPPSYRSDLISTPVVLITDRKINLRDVTVDVDMGVSLRGTEHWPGGLMTAGNPHLCSFHRCADSSGTAS